MSWLIQTLHHYPEIAFFLTLAIVPVGNRYSGWEIHFQMHPGALVGVCAGAPTTTASLGAVQDGPKSNVPALGYKYKRTQTKNSAS
ncbi:MAG TPA: hypothetical protein VNY07_13020 [Chthoniobacterales bacterium]|jgi:uncharacterized transporter YbjL|nr:hypothetical protein [Chthoniobacterales bacterium]